MEVGVLNQVVRIKKDSQCLMLNMGGLTLNTYFAFVEIYRFVKTYLESVKAYFSNFTIQTSQESYEQFIKDIEYVQKIYPEYDEETRERVRRIIENQIQSEGVRRDVGEGRLNLNANSSEFGMPRSRLLTPGSIEKGHNSVSRLIVAEQQSPGRMLPGAAMGRMSPAMGASKGPSMAQKKGGPQFNMR